MGIAMTPWFNVRKAAQVTAFFAKAEGGDINVLKLAKLLYLSDRKFLEKYDCPILNDRFVSMPHGPVTSMTLTYVDGYQQDHRADWDEFVSRRAGYNIGLTDPELSEEALDELSEAELEVLNEVWDQFGHMNQYQIRNYTHNNCLEWENPYGASNPIPYERVFKFLGKANSDALAARISSERALDETLAAD